MQMPVSDAVKVKGVITWAGVAAEVRPYDRLFTEAQPDAGGKDFLASLHPDCLKTVTAYVAPSLAQAEADDKFQFERHGQFGYGITSLREVCLRRNAQVRCVADRKDHGKGILAQTLTESFFLNQPNWNKFSTSTGITCSAVAFADSSSINQRTDFYFKVAEKIWNKSYLDTIFA